VGRLTTIKGYPYLLRATAIIARTFPHVRLVLVGDGPERAALADQAQKLGLDQIVRLVGFSAEVAEYIGMFDVFVLSSLHEGISISLLEALGLGVPAVVTAVGGNPEVIHPGRNGLTVPPGDEHALAAACLSLLADEGQRQEMGRRGQALVRQEFTKERMADKVQQLYEEICR
jgi:glycosyltransferase involved in cell wall biosynthesis